MIHKLVFLSWGACFTTIALYYLSELLEYVLRKKGIGLLTEQDIMNAFVGEK